jgi:hypothetical protein
MPREIGAKIDALVVEGPDDGVVVNAFVHKTMRLEIGGRRGLVRTSESGGYEWALRQFAEFVRTAHPGARVGLIVDRDQVDNDKWPSVREQLRGLGADVSEPRDEGVIVDGRFGIWMWPDNVSHGALEAFVASIIPRSSLLTFASETARREHGAEFNAAHAGKAALKVRSVWRDASAAGGYGHLVRGLDLVDTPASVRFRAWFTALFLT